MDYNKFYNMIMNDIKYLDEKVKAIKAFLPDLDAQIEAIASVEKIIKTNKSNLIEVWSQMDLEVFRNIVDQYCNNVLFLGLHMPYVITQAMGDGIINKSE